MFIGHSLALTQPRGFARTPFTFTASDDGAWYDASDLLTLFQDSAKTTAVAAAGDPVGAVEDKSGNAHDASQATASKRPIWGDDGTYKFIEFDEVDDALDVTFPNLGTACTIATLYPGEAQIDEGQTVNGAYSLPASDWYQHVVVDKALSLGEFNQMVQFFNTKGPVNYAVFRNRMQTLTLNAVDVFIYDTTLDSDGGAWRTGAKALASSWYSETLNTATRGATAAFPAQVMIVAEAAKVTIYDATDPALPMWMVFNTSGVDLLSGSSVLTSISMLNGCLVVGDSLYDLKLVNLISDTGNRYGTPGISIDYQGNISARNSSSGWGGATTPNIISRACNDVVMTVLSGAPIDPATGIATPTIAVATDGGGTYSVSVITNSGTVYDVVDDSTGTALSVSISSTDELIVVRSDGAVYVWNDIGAIAADGTAPDSTITGLLGTVSMGAAA